MSTKKTSRGPTKTPQAVSSAPITVSPEGEVSIRLSGLDMPDRAFSANWVSYDVYGDRVDLVFGQMIGGRTSLTSALVISVPKERAIKHFELPIPPSEGRFVASLREFVAKSGGSVREVEAVKLDALPDDRIAFESASIFSVAFTGTEAEIAFLKLSPLELHRFRTEGFKGGIAHPVARVFLSTELLLDLVEALTRELSDDQGREL